MEKFIVYFSDNSKVGVWAIDKKMARYHLEHIAKKNGTKIIKVEKYKEVA